VESVTGVDTPVAAFHKLFSNDSTPLELRQQRMSEQRSVLDTVMSDATRVFTYRMPCNLWLSTLRGCGIAATSHGDSTGVIEQLP
jgi:hypothetical protein